MDTVAVKGWGCHQELQAVVTCAAVLCHHVQRLAACTGDLIVWYVLTLRMRRS